MSAENLHRRLKTRGARLEKRALECVRDAALTLEVNLVEQTPVDTGQALSGWVVSIDLPYSREPGPYVPGQRGSTREANVVAALADTVLTLRNLRSGQDVYVVNDVDYIGKLNDGSSPQHPGGFVENSVAAARRKVRGKKLLE